MVLSPLDTKGQQNTGFDVHVQVICNFKTAQNEVVPIPLLAEIILITKF